LTYKVKSGDVLGGIASKHGVTVSQLKQWNKLSGNLIRVGQTLYIHSEKPVASGAKPAGSLAENSKGLNQKTYTVKPGDSLWIISQKHSLSIEQIKRLNNLNSNQIKPGQRLIIG
jgi:membrane-bound lytic murein transglycosylase D